MALAPCLPRNSVGGPPLRGVVLRGGGRPGGQKNPAAMRRWVCVERNEGWVEKVFMLWHFSLLLACEPVGAV